MPLPCKNEINSPHKEIFSCHFDPFNIFYMRNYCSIRKPMISLQYQKSNEGFDEGLNLTKVPSEYRVLISI
ncbi:hypothetical protein DW191_00535 [Parabacteroides merdae]|uniref:Uncharacterized protein n=1 Tax=Parabacteroides merdae TaxID=46503 RepID=A0A414Y0T3_9BACT|nr:hypothetical protein DW191_00535 [Parabacteroides merdae]